MNNTKKIYIDVLLKDNMIMDYHISPNRRTMPHDYYKTFIYANYDWNNCDKEFEVKWIAVEFEDIDDKEHRDLNNYIFDEISRTFFKQWKIHPNHFGSAAY